MNILKELAGKINGQIVLRTALDEENCSFLWNEPATIEEIEAFEKKHQCSFPEAYKEFLLISNGATLFKTESGSNGYQLLSLKEMEEETQEIREDGYIISDKCYCFIKFLFNGMLLLKASSCIAHADFNPICVFDISVVNNLVYLSKSCKL